MTGKSGDGDGAFGQSVTEWERRLTGALERGDHAELKQTLLTMRTEMRCEAGELGRFGRAPFLDRLSEHTRRLLRSEPTDIEALETELAAERKAWAGFRRRFRATFVPEDLHPFLRSCGVFISPDRDGVQFDGFDKYSGLARGPRREAITLFVRNGEPPDDEEGYVPPNFFSFYNEAHCDFEVRRAYRTVLPKGSGTDCILEHVERLVPDIGELEQFGFEDVQNRPTYGAYVEDLDGDLRLRDLPGIDATPLGRVAIRVLAKLGLELNEELPNLDPYDVLDLSFSVRSV
ncbi:MAG: hypothetical protein JRF63_10070 [Deltaproteobacteria bacterium]|nr:hypothetical protein [Deltaproteobacteria bacterium]